MFMLIWMSIIVLVVSYVCVMCAIDDPGCFDDVKTEAKEAQRYFVSLHGNIF